MSADEKPFQRTQAERRSHLRLLISMARVDHRYPPEEDLMIREVARRMDIDHHELDEIRHSPPEEKLVLPTDEHGRVVIFYHLLYLMRVDGAVEEDERNLCRRLGFALCLNPYLVDDLIELAVQHPKEPLPSEELAGVVQKYLN